MDWSHQLDSITISKHGYLNGQKIISTATTSPGGLVDNGIYYVYVVDENNIKLCNEYYESINPIPHIIDITSAYGGTISPINPRISLERNQQVDFDLSVEYTIQGEELQIHNTISKLSTNGMLAIVNTYYQDQFSSTTTPTSIPEFL